MYEFRKICIPKAHINSCVLTKKSTMKVERKKQKRKIKKQYTRLLQEVSVEGHG